MSEKVAPLPEAWARAMAQPDDVDAFKSAALAFVRDALEIALRHDMPTITVTGQKTPVPDGPIPHGFALDPGVTLAFKDGPHVTHWQSIARKVQEASSVVDVLDALAADWSRS